MNWSMPRPVLQLAAAALATACLGSFVLGVVTAPSRSRLPGERPDGAVGPAIEAQDVTPLIDERIQGNAPEELTPEEQAKLEAEKKAKAEAAALAKAEAEKGAPAGPEAVVPLAPALPPAKAEPAEKATPAPKLEEPVF